MSRIRPRSHTKAYSQTEIFLHGKYDGHRIIARRDAKIAAGLICKIWKYYQVGIHQLKLKHVLGYLANNPIYFINDPEHLKKNAIYRMLVALKKETWILEIEAQLELYK